MRPLSTAPLMPWVPVFEPRGAATWQQAPEEHFSLGRHHAAFDQISVGFMRVSPYLQYVTVCLTPSISRTTSSNQRIFRSIPLGFSMNHHRGRADLMRSTVFLTSCCAATAR